MARQMAEMYRKLYMSPTSVGVITALIATNTPVPMHTPEDQRQVKDVIALSRHGDAEVECEAEFNAEPGIWQFRVTRTGRANEVYLTPASAAQHFELFSDITNLQMNGIDVPVSLHDLSGMAPH